MTSCLIGICIGSAATLIAIWAWGEHKKQRDLRRVTQLYRQEQEARPRYHEPIAVVWFAPERDERRVNCSTRGRA